MEVGLFYGHRAAQRDELVEVKPLRLEIIRLLRDDALSLVVGSLQKNAVDGNLLSAVGSGALTDENWLIDLVARIPGLA